MGFVGHRAAQPAPRLAERGLPGMNNDTASLPKIPGTNNIRRATKAKAGDSIRMARGTVKWFNATKGYGFIQPQDGGKDVFVHISAVERAGLASLNEGQSIEYEEVANKGKTSAENLKVQR